MKFIDDLCEKMISPLKIRYSIHDLSLFLLTKTPRIPAAQSGLISLSKTARSKKYKPVSITPATLHKTNGFACFICTV